jgi:SAM-dependent methyltransferase
VKKRATDNVHRTSRSGWTGWDDYASFYDWENVRTFGRRDVQFWCDIVRRERGRVLELGCGTGRLLAPLSRAGRSLIGIDRSPAMLEIARRKIRRLRVRPVLVRGDVTQLPLASGSVHAVIGPYGLLQSLVTERDLDAALCETARVLRRGGLFGVELVPELPVWAEHGPRVQLTGTLKDGSSVELIESVRQNRRRGLTIFQERFVTRRGSRARIHRFSLVFRTEPMPRLLERLERSGLRAEALLGDYAGTPWTLGADAWIVLARKR